MEENSQDQIPETNFQPLNQETDIYRQMFKHSVIPILIHDLEMNIYDANDKAIEQFGYSREELLQKKVYDLHPENTQKHSEQVRKRMEREEKLSVEAYFRRKDGSVFIAEATPTKYLLKGKPLIHVYIQDITRRKKDEIKLQKTMEKAEESDRLKSTFLANIRHEIRTPMTGIIGFSSVLRKKDLPPELVKKYATTICKSGEHLLNIINNIIDISTIEAGQMVVSRARVDLHALLREVFDFFDSYLQTNKIKGLELKPDIPSADLFVITDETRLRQILLNLISNAIKYTRKGLIEFGYERENKKLRFYVKDNGMGIPEREQEKVFERFHQASSSPEIFEGTGLGLSIAKACAELLNGEIWLQSKEGEGTTFYFTIEYLPV